MTGTSRPPLPEHGGAGRCGGWRCCGRWRRCGGWRCCGGWRSCGRWRCCGRWRRSVLILELEERRISRRRPAGAPAVGIEQVDVVLTGGQIVGAAGDVVAGGEPVGPGRCGQGPPGLAVGAGVGDRSNRPSPGGRGRNAVGWRRGRNLTGIPLCGAKVAQVDRELPGQDAVDLGPEIAVAVGFDDVAATPGGARPSDASALDAWPLPTVVAAVVIIGHETGHLMNAPPWSPTLVP